MEGEKNQEVGRRKEEERVGPSSSASRDAAASKCLSDGSQPPLGTAQVSITSEWCPHKKTKIMTYKPNDLIVCDSLLGELCQRFLR